MPWTLLLQTLLPIILTPGHPHAPEAHAVLASAAVAAPAPLTPAATLQDHVAHQANVIDVLTRSLDLINKASAISGAPLSPVGLQIAQQLAGLLSRGAK